MSELVINGVYQHFKGTLHKVLTIAKHTETGEELVIYTHEDTGEIRARPKEMFLSPVDHEKYPDIPQKLRFQLQTF